MKDTDEQPGDRVRRVRSGGALSLGTSVPMDLTHSPTSKLSNR